MIEYRWDDGSLVRFDLTLYLRHVYGDEDRGRDDIAEARRRVGFLKLSGMSEQDAFEAAVAGMRADRDVAEQRTRHIRTWHLWTRVRGIVGAASHPDAREEDRVSAIVAAVHDEALARMCGIVSPAAVEEIEAATAWYADLLDTEFRTDLDEFEPYPLSVAKESWDQVPSEWRREARSRAGFLILRGNRPEVALKEAVRQIEAETAEWLAAGSYPVWYNLLREVARLYDNQRLTSGSYCRWFYELMHHVHEAGMARLTSDPAFVDRKPTEDELLHVDGGAEAVERLTRLYCDRIRIAVHLETLDEAQQK